MLSPLTPSKWERSRHSEAAAEFRCSFEEKNSKQFVPFHVLSARNERAAFYNA
jgi:hypothetical protein